MQKITASVVVFYTPEHKVLMHSRTRDGDISKTKWTFLGGKMEEGETPEIAARREIQEELGFDLVELEYLRKYHYSGISQKEYEIYSYLAPFPGFNEFNPTSSEVNINDLQLMTLDEGQKLKNLPVAYEILNDLKSKWH